MRAIAAPLAAAATAVLLAGCHPSGASKQANADARASAAGFVPPATQMPKPLPGQRNVVPLTVYVGKYPRDVINGVGFFDRTEVANALIGVVADPQLRRTISGNADVQMPIFRQGERIAAAGCEPHNCSDHGWTFLVRPDGTQGEACLHTAAMGGASRWYTGGTPAMRPGGCPSA